MKPPLREQLRGQELPEDELSETEQHLLRQMLDRGLEARLAKALAEKGVHKAKTARLRPRWWLVAAAVLLVGSLGWWLYTLPSEGVRLAQTYVESPFQLNKKDFRDDGHVDQQRDAIFAAYLKGDYALVLQSVAPLITSGRADNKDYFLAGLSSLYSAQYDQATQYFLQARALNPTAYASEISWHLGLAYVFLHENEKARIELEKVAASSDSRDNDKAAALLKAISR